jgi:hypothetical protein
VLYFIDSSVEPKDSKRAPPAPRGGITRGPLKDPLAVARARRDRVLTFGKWYTAPEVAQLLNGAVARSNPSQYASTLRRQRRLLGFFTRVNIFTLNFNSTHGSAPSVVRPRSYFKCFQRMRQVGARHFGVSSQRVGSVDAVQRTCLQRTRRP